MKLPVPWDWRSGMLNALAIAPGRDGDSPTALQAVELTPGSGRITDRGSVETEVLQHRDRPGVFGISRLPCGPAVWTPAGPRRPWLAGRAQGPGPLVAQPLRLGTERPVAGRVGAGRGPAAVAHRRRPQLRRGPPPGRPRAQPAMPGLV